jgi:hypothetical protein
MPARHGAGGGSLPPTTNSRVPGKRMPSASPGGGAGQSRRSEAGAIAAPSCYLRVSQNFHFELTPGVRAYCSRPVASSASRTGAATQRRRYRKGYDSDAATVFGAFTETMHGGV